jgi:hypothetical protein
MANPWLKKNPFLSLWLSGANAAAGSMRGRISQQARRQGATAVRIMTNAMLDAWTAPWVSRPSRKKRSKSRSR